MESVTDINQFRQTHRWLPKGRQKGSKNRIANYPCDCGCGQLIKPPLPHKVRKGKKHYASIECFRRDIQVRRKVKTTCNFCKKEFLAKGHLLRAGKARFCSNRCKSDARKKRITAVCTVCTAEFIRETWRIERSKVLFCGQFCFKVYKLLGKHRNNRTIYTAEFLKCLMEYDGDDCALPDCDQPQGNRGYQKTFHLCRVHGRRLHGSLRSRSKYRRKMLRNERLAA